MKTNFSILLLAMALGSSALADQVCVDDIDRSAPEARFAIIEGGAMVLDLRYNLMWRRCPLGYTFSDNGTVDQPRDDSCVLDDQATFSWQEALQAVDAASVRALRMPNVKELSSLVEISCSWPAINTYLFPDTPPVDFWTSTPNGPTGARTVSFDSGLVTSGSRSGQKAVRAVADAAGPPS